MPYTLTHRSILGTRAEQQDCCFAQNTQNTAFAVVCDGMGGLGYGSKASAVAMAALRELFAQKQQAQPMPEFFLRAVDVLDECVVNLKDSKGEKCNAGTTIVAAAIDDNKLHWLSVGDSRLYILRGNEIAQITRDHNYFLSLKKMKQNAEITTLQFYQEAKRGEALISYIGMGGVQIMDINEAPFQLLPGDIILLTTDGLTKALQDNEILAILRDGNLEQALDHLIKQATKKAVRSQDNTTCVAIQYN